MTEKMTDERLAFLEREANRNVHAWGFLLTEALDETVHLRAELAAKDAEIARKDRVLSAIRHIALGNLPIEEKLLDVKVWINSEPAP